MPIELHELHRRKIEATVQLMEDGLNRAERLLHEGGHKGIVLAVENSLAEHERSRLLQKLGELRATLGHFAGQFGLKHRPLDIRQVLDAEFSSAWIMLENCRPKRMKGYGVPFDEVTRNMLEEGLEELLAQVKDLRAMVR